MILDEIAAKTKERIRDTKSRLPIAEVKAMAADREARPDFKAALAGADISFICEVKRASPSKGMIAEDFLYLQIAREYEQAGASAISVLTEPFYFKGADKYLDEISKSVNIPLLRKDFTVDEYMIYEARAYGASAVLLICSILGKSQIKEYLDITHSLGMSALVEAHDEDEVQTALECGAGIIGVNNRDLKTFTVDLENSIRLRAMVPPEVVFVSESGMKTAQDIRRLRENNVNAVLIGETLMRAENKKKMLDELRGH